MNLDLGGAPSLLEYLSQRGVPACSSCGSAARQVCSNCHQPVCANCDTRERGMPANQRTGTSKERVVCIACALEAHDVPAVLNSLCTRIKDLNRLAGSKTATDTGATADRIMSLAHTSLVHLACFEAIAHNQEEDRYSEFKKRIRPFLLKAIVYAYAKPIRENAKARQLLSKYLERYYEILLDYCRAREDVPVSSLTIEGEDASSAAHAVLLFEIRLHRLWRFFRYLMFNPAVDVLGGLADVIKKRADPILEKGLDPIVLNRVQQARWALRRSLEFDDYNIWTHHKIFRSIGAPKGSDLIEPIDFLSRLMLAQLLLGYAHAHFLSARGMFNDIGEWVVVDLRRMGATTVRIFEGIDELSDHIKDPILSTADALQGIRASMERSEVNRENERLTAEAISRLRAIAYMDSAQLCIEVAFAEMSIKDTYPAILERWMRLLLERFWESLGTLESRIPNGTDAEARRTIMTRAIGIFDARYRELLARYHDAHYFDSSFQSLLHAYLWNAISALVRAFLIRGYDTRAAKEIVAEGAAGVNKLMDLQRQYGREAYLDSCIWFLKRFSDIEEGHGSEIVQEEHVARGEVAPPEAERIAVQEIPIVHEPIPLPPRREIDLEALLRMLGPAIRIEVDEENPSGKPDGVFLPGTDGVLVGIGDRLSRSVVLLGEHLREDLPVAQGAKGVRPGDDGPEAHSLGYASLDATTAVLASQGSDDNTLPPLFVFVRMPDAQGAEVPFAVISDAWIVREDRPLFDWIARPPSRTGLAVEVRDALASGGHEGPQILLDEAGRYLEDWVWDLLHGIHLRHVGLHLSGVLRAVQVAGNELFFRWLEGDDGIVRLSECITRQQEGE